MNNKNIYGAIYNWYATVYFMDKLCPIGWRVPSDTDWHTLALALDPNAQLIWGEESSIAGGKLKETGTLHWRSPNTGATNESGFTALPGGYRQNTGASVDAGSMTYWWSSSEVSPNNAIYRGVRWNDSNLDRHANFKNIGFYVRCIKN